MGLVIAFVAVFFGLPALSIIASLIAMHIESKYKSNQTYNVEDNRPGWEDEETRRRQVAKYGYSSGYRPKPTKGKQNPPGKE